MIYRQRFRFLPHFLCLAVLAVMAGSASGGVGGSGDQDRSGAEYQDEEFQDAETDSLEFHRGNLNIWYSWSELAGDPLRRLKTWTLMYSQFEKTSTPGFRGHLGLYFGRGTKGSQHYVQEEIRWINEVGLELGGRDYFASDNSLMGSYLLMGARIGALFWSYNHDIEVPDQDGGYKWISKDSVLMVTPYIGLGTSFLQTELVHFGVSLTVGARFSVGKTWHNLSNDVFKDVAEFRLNFEASVFF